MMDITETAKTGWKRGGRVGLVLLGGAILLGVAVTAALIVSRPGAPPPEVAPTSILAQSGKVLADPATQENIGGDVTVSITWQGPQAGMVFNVVMDTHSVDLDVYDLGQMVVLHTLDGRESAPLSWDAPIGGHHRAGNLTFSDRSLDGKPFIGPDTAGVELVIYDLSGVPERSFKWVLR